MFSDVHYLIYVKGAERYCFVWIDSQRAELFRVLGRFASNPDLSFTWYDAAIISHKVRTEAAEFERTAGGRISGSSECGE
jgi:hypothetical protein